MDNIMNFAEAAWAMRWWIVAVIVALAVCFYFEEKITEVDS